MSTKTDAGAASRDIRVEWLLPSQLKPYINNARVHPPAQIKKLKKSIAEFGFLNPILTDEFYEIIAGHGRLIAAQELGLEQIPVIRIAGLNDKEKRALRLADNQIGVESVWDIDLVRLELQAISLDVDFDIELTGFSLERTDVILAQGAADPAEEVIPEAPTSPISARGDIWLAGPHRIGCGDAKDQAFLRQVVGETPAAAAVLDVPYNVKIQGHAGGKGRIKHREFAEASGEMSAPEFIAFLTASLGACAAISRNGAVHFVFIDHAHIDELLAAGSEVYGARLNICVWNKSNAGMGSLWRSKMELIPVFRVGDAPHRNNVQLGRHGRNRTNVWNYPSVNTFRGGRRHDLAIHPTVKPTSLVADAIMDVTVRGEIVLDAFLGSGTTLIACERVERRFVGGDIDPVYVDVALRRWRQLTGKDPIRERDGRAFSELEAEAGK